MLVDGAMAATSPESVMKVAAEPAPPPSGATQVMTGIGLARMALSMSSMLARSPPGESISMMTAAAPPSAEALRPSWMYVAVIWSITPSKRMRATWSPAPEAGAASERVPRRKATSVSARRRATMMGRVYARFRSVPGAGLEAADGGGRLPVERHEGELRPRLQALPRGQHFVRGREAADELLVLADRDGVAIGLHREYDAKVHRPHRVGIVIQETDEPEVRLELG